MFFKHKLLFFIIQLIFCIVLIYFVNQQVILVGLLNNLIVDLIIIYILLVAVASLIAQILTQLCIIFFCLIKCRYHKKFIFWFSFTICCYLLNFGIFAILIEY